MHLYTTNEKIVIDYRGIVSVLGINWKGLKVK